MLYPAAAAGGDTYLLTRLAGLTSSSLESGESLCGGSEVGGKSLSGRLLVLFEVQYE